PVSAPNQGGKGGQDVLAGTVVVLRPSSGQLLRGGSCGVSDDRGGQLDAFVANVHTGTCDEPLHQGVRLAAKGAGDEDGVGRGRGSWHAVLLLLADAPEGGRVGFTSLSGTRPDP